MDLSSITSRVPCSKQASWRKLMPAPLSVITMANRTDDNPTELTVLSSGPAPQSRQSPSLVVILGEPIGQRIDVLGTPIRVGRSPDCDLHIPHSSVSRAHCLIWRDGDSYRLRDLKSTNKTYLNDIATVEAELKDGDQITVGEIVIKFIGRTSREARYHDELYQLATHDSLTELYNRRQFRELLDKQVTQVLKHQQSLALAIVDIDHFKQINDRHGHHIGDHVLRALADTIRASVSTDHIAARIGGEEFGLIFPEMDLGNAARLCDGLRQSIADRTAAPGTEHSVSASIGVALWRSEMRIASDLLRAADTQLYRAKAAGRNRVCWPEAN
jgi:diguanylate cyclase (GGDEF)-like protein